MSDKPIESFDDKFERLSRSPSVLLFVGGIALIIFSGWLWWTRVYTSPKAVWNGMLSQNLSLSAVQVHHTSKASNGVVVDKTSQLVFTPKQTVDIKATTKSSDGKDSVQTETIATPAAEYNRYVAIKTSKTASDGTPLDTASVLNKWAKAAPADTSGQGLAGGNAYDQTVLQPYGLGLGRIKASQRAILMTYLQNNAVFSVNYDVSKSKQQGRQLYTYKVQIQPVAYLGFAKTLAQDMGLKDLDDLDPNQAQGSASVPVTVTVDMRSRHLVKADYSTLGYSETYSYDSAQPASEPKTTIPSQDLQALVGQLQ